jgi:hypothetical protein
MLDFFILPLNIFGNGKFENNVNCNTFIFLVLNI